MLGLVLSLVAAVHAADQARLADPDLKECSGIVASRRQPGVFFAHNDSGNPPVLFAFDVHGKSLGKFPVAAENRDWEDIARADDGLYLADTGNNSRGRREVTVLRLAEPDLQKPPTEALPVMARWRLQFPAAPFDCETLLLIGKHGYLVEKDAGKPAGIYRFALNGPEKQTLERVAEVPQRGWWTGGDTSPDGRRLLLVQTAGFSLYELTGELSGLATSKVTHVVDIDADREAGCLLADGGVLTATEARSLRHYSPAAIAAGIRRLPVVPDIELSAAPTNLVVDGRLDEWGARAPVEHRSTKGSPPGARLWIGWQAQALVVAGLVPDDHVEPGNKRAWFTGDCAEVFLGADEADHTGSYGPDDNRAAVLFETDKPGLSPTAQLIWPMHLQNPIPGAQVAAVIHAGRWEFEAVIPWKGKPLVEGGKIRCAVSVLSSRPKANWYLGSANDQGVYATPLLWARARLKP
jgi:hypothetical protein